ncbi:Phosphatidylinositol 3- and 4-kinase, putative [Angomonas deanei]|uniref:Phosphatidylinositol 3- and 4-kinase, putative n=1 Tax=Angomonas deanei TaxID=59799 RepID=A0A7G2CWV1_9TRYP|nr:Phosphatidylinositol 3- and 4-kinase, putative [Angomonas deanei]
MLETFQLDVLSGKEEINAEMQSDENSERHFVERCIKQDVVFRTSLAGEAISTTRHDTLTAVKQRHRRAASEPNKNNNNNNQNKKASDGVYTFGSSELLKDATWETEEESLKNNKNVCHGCQVSLSSGRGWLSFGARRTAENCRSCGYRFCKTCVDGSLTAHKSFAALQAPAAKEGLYRVVCRTCHAQAARVAYHRYLVTLFAQSGFDFFDLFLCRGVNGEFRRAAELFITDYRSLLHSCRPDGHQHPHVKALLKNSVPLILPQSLSDGFHPEVALLLLQFLKEEDAWETPVVAQVVASLSQQTIEQFDRPPVFSHLQFFCSSTCCTMRPLFFYTRVLELTGTVADRLKSEESYDSLPEEERQQLVEHYTTCLTRVQEHIVTCLNYIQDEERNKRNNHHHKNKKINAYLEFMTMKLIQWIFSGFRERHRNEKFFIFRKKVLSPLVQHVCRSDLRCGVNLYFSLHSIERTHVMTKNKNNNQNKDNELAIWSVTIENLYPEGTATRLKNTFQFFSNLDLFLKKTGTYSVSAVVYWLSQQSPTCVSSSPKIAEPHVTLPYELLNPFHPSMVFTAVETNTVRVLSSAVQPLLLTFLTSEKERVPLLFKRDSLVQDQYMCVSVRLLLKILADAVPEKNNNNNFSVHDEHYNLEHAIPTYSTLSLTDHDCGLVEICEGTVQSKLPQRLNEFYNKNNNNPNKSSSDAEKDSTTLRRREAEKLVYNFLTRELNVDDKNKNMDANVNRVVLEREMTFLTSAKVFILVNYIFSLGDRHTDNILFNDDGAIFHIDFGYIFFRKTLVEKITRNTVRIDADFLYAVTRCQRQQLEIAQNNNNNNKQKELEDKEVQSIFLEESADWFSFIRPHVGLFFSLWCGAIHRGVLKDFPHEASLASMFDTLFDREVSVDYARQHFVSHLTSAMGKCWWYDASHEYASWLQSLGRSIQSKAKVW